MIVSLLKIDSGLLEQVNIKTGECIVSCLDADELEGILPKAEIVIAGGDFDDTMMKKCVGMKWLHIMGAGVDKLPFGDLRDRKVLVSNSRGIHKTQMAEHVIGMMIAFSRKLYMAVKNQARKDWKHGLPVDELLGKTACIIGTGSIGQEIARKLSVFDMKVLGIGKVPHQLEWFDKVYGPEDLQYVLGVSDYVIACVPLTDETYHMLGREEFNSVKAGCILINVSRGDVVDENAMIEALNGNQLAGAGLDVFHVEPLPKDNPLWYMENVIITPHNAGLSPYYMKRAMELFTENLILYRQGKMLINSIDLERQY